MRKTVERAVLIVLVGVGLGLVGNAVSPRGIPLITPPKKQPKPDEFIKIEKAKEAKLKAQAAKEQLKKQAAAKLTKEEKEALGLK